MFVDHGKKRSSGFCRFFTVAFLLFLAAAGSSSTAGVTFLFSDIFKSNGYVGKHSLWHICMFHNKQYSSTSPLPSSNFCFELFENKGVSFLLVLHLARLGYQVKGSPLNSDLALREKITEGKHQKDC